MTSSKFPSWSYSMSSTNMGSPQPDELSRPPELTPKASAPFKLISNLFEFLTTAPNARGNSAKALEYRRSTVRRTISMWRQTIGLDLHPLVRLLLPQRDRERSYGVKEQTIGKLFADAMGLDRKTSSAAVKLHSWKQPLKGSSFAGDFAQVAYEIIKDRCPIVTTEGKYSVDDVNNVLDELSKAHGEPAKRAVLKKIYSNMTATEQKWIIRIILKDLRISLSESLVLGEIHKDAKKLFNVCSDLRRVCWTLWSPTKSLRIDETSVRLFMAFRPMLSQRNSKGLDDIVKRMQQANADGCFYIEEKLDGERIQLHKRGEEYRYWSRNNMDYTYLYGRSRMDETGSLTRYIHELFHKNAADLVLDGEMLAYHQGLDKVLPFGTLKSAASDSQNNNITVCYRVFDVLYARGRMQKNGKSLINSSLKERRKALKELFSPLRGRLELVNQTEGTTRKDIESRFNEIMEQLGEGLIIKNPKSKYFLDGRNDSWIKVKPDYMDELGENMDLTVIGACYGQGKRGGIYGSFWCGLKDESSSRESPRYLSFVKVGSGFKADQLESLKVDYEWQPWPKERGKRLPTSVIFASEKPDVYIDPLKSFVIEVKAAQIVEDAKTYAAGYCLRFPRCVAIRTDKDPNDGLSLSDFLEMKELSSLKRHNSDSQQYTTSRKKRKVTKSRKRQETVTSSQKGADVTNTKHLKKQIFRNMLFRVFTGFEDKSKQDVETLIYEHGGEFRQKIPTDKDCTVIAEKFNLVLPRGAHAKGHNLVHPKWILECIEKGGRLRLTKKHFVAVAEGKNVDSDGDGDEFEAVSSPEESNEENAGVEYEEQSKVEELEKNPKVESTKIHELSEDEIMKSEVHQAEVSATVDIKSEDDDSKNNILRKFRYNSDHDINNDTEEETEESIAEIESEMEFEKGSHNDENQMTENQSSLKEDVDEIKTGKENSLLFKKIVFYLDTSEAATINDIGIIKIENDEENYTRSLNEEPFKTLRLLIVSNGGRITENLNDPGMTHIVLVAPDITRIGTFVSKTKEPRRRRLVKTTWVIDSVEEHTLLNEADYAPFM